jgi:hypothetical protein
MKHSLLFEPFSPFRQRQLYKTAFAAVINPKVRMHLGLFPIPRGFFKDIWLFL